LRLVSHLTSAKVAQHPPQPSSRQALTDDFLNNTDFLAETRLARSVNMPKNKGKGGKNRRRGKNENEYVAALPTLPPSHCGR
jgi:hypothetical protein